MTHTPEQLYAAMHAVARDTPRLPAYSFQPFAGWGYKPPQRSVQPTKEIVRTEPYVAPMPVVAAPTAVVEPAAVITAAEPVWLLDIAIWKTRWLWRLTAVIRRLR